MWRFLTGVKPPPQKKAKLSKTDARYEKEKRKREPQKTWKDKRPWLQFTPDGTMICSYCVDAVESKGKVNMLLKALRRQKWMVFFSSALQCVGFSTGQPRIHQGNQIHGFGCPAFEIGTTWIFFLISSTAFENKSGQT